MVADAFLNEFQSPPAAYRPAPFFVFNDDHEGLAGEARITRMLEDYRRIGFGGAFLHPRPGLITEYLSPRWFELIRHAVRECGRLGLVPYIYDENSYPSGVGGGHVPALAPEARTRYVTPVFGDRPSAIPHNHLALYRMDGEDPGELTTAKDLRPGERWVAFVMDSMRPMPWHGETAAPSLLDPRTAEAFLESTYEAYRRELGELWPDVPAIFTDEPHLTSPGHGPWNEGLHMTPELLGQFQQRRGYDLRPHLASLYYDVGDFRKIRFDVYDLMHELWVERWALPMEAWCDAQGKAFTGHYLEHDWPCPYATPGHVHLLAHMHWPGTDMLETFVLRGHDDFDVQNFHPAKDGQEPQGLYYLRQTHSIANQFGKERVLDESWGAGGNDSTPADWSRIGRWLVVHGVNLFNPHLSFMTIRGTRKTDHPQTFSDHSPWFDELRPFNDELSRLAWASNQGTIEQRVLLLDPLTSGFCQSRKADCLPLPDPDEVSGATATAAAPPEEDEFRRSLASVIDLQAEMGNLAQALSDAQADVDIGDEYVLAESGRVENGRLTVGVQTYELLVWPGCLTNLRRQTVALLERYLASGGAIYGVRPSDLTVDGRPSDVLADLESRFGDGLRWFDSNGALQTAILAAVPPHLQVERAPATGLAHMRRVLPDGELFLIVNSSPEAIDSPIRIETDRSHLVTMEPLDGSLSLLATQRDGHVLAAVLRLKPRASTILFATDDAGETAPPPVRVEVIGDGVPLQLTGAIRTEPNVLVIDSCGLEVGGETFPREQVYAANHRLWRYHGFETNGWMAVIQYRDQLLARNRTMLPESGGSVTYRFQIDAGVETDGIRLAVETPELWAITLNDQPVDFRAGDRWLDHNFGVTEVGSLLRSGENVVRLDGRPFDVRREIDQIYLLGEFGVQPDNPGFRIVALQALGLGSWRQQGHPFYDRAVTYTFTLPESAGSGVLALDAADWSGSFLIVEQAGEVIARLWEPPYQVRLDASRGRDIAIRIVGLPKNLLGPWHDPGKPRFRAWVSMWYGSSIPLDPQPGDRYDLLDLGLIVAPRWVNQGR